MRRFTPQSLLLIGLIAGCLLAPKVGTAATNLDELLAQTQKARLEQQHNDAQRE